MINVSDLSLSYGQRVLFKDVSVLFNPGNCYGIIGANGAGKTTFLNILAGIQDYDRGDIRTRPGERIAILKQDHYAFERFSVLDTVFQGFPALYAVQKEREALYAKTDFTEEDGIRVAELESEFAELGGWEADSQAGQLLSGLGLTEADQEKMMSALNESQKVRILLAQALFGSPDILLLDEPTNGLDLESINWLEEFLIEFPGTVIVVSHDRHFLNAVCTTICDIDFGRITPYSGNYDFWYHMSQMLQRQGREQQKRNEERARELKEFIQRFASNAAKSRQATSRKKILEKLDLENIHVTSRKFPYISFKPEREIGTKVLDIENLSIQTAENTVLLDNFSFTVGRNDKIAFVGSEHTAKTALFDTITGARTANSGTCTWGQTVNYAYFPKENNSFFNVDLSISEWLRQFAQNQDETAVRSFLGRLLFSGDESQKSVKVLSGGERVRCLLAKMMLSSANVLIFDEPTNHLDLEAINALNEGLINFPSVILFNSHDHEFVQSIANRIIEIFADGTLIDRRMVFDDYLQDETVKQLRLKHSPDGRLRI
ncbi:putative ABC transporter ATP-binding protein YbiT [Pillotina sp. SPG140]|jgi:ATPase subunit of ABC transporter with duplicated ATPase domains